MSTLSTKRSWLSAILAGIFVLLLGVIGWMEFGHSPPTQVAKDDIKSISIRRSGHADIDMVRTGTLWKMTTPYALSANTQRIDPLLSLGTANFDGYDKTEVDLPATGLSTPAASITIGSREFLLGEPHADGQRRYTLVDDKVSFVPDWVWSLVHGGVTAFSDLTIFTDLPDGVFLIKGNQKGSQKIKLHNIEQWRSLQADKVTELPNELIAAGQEQNEAMLWQLSSMDNTSPADQLAKLLRLDDRTLIQTKPGFAYAISNARFDALLKP